MKEKLDLSIIIVNYNTPDLVREAVESCLSASAGLDIEIIVVDNNSTEKFSNELFGTKEVIIINQVNNSGFATAVNAGVEKSQGKYSLLLNSDAKINDGALHKMVNCLDIYENAACVGGRIRASDNLTEVSYGYFPNLTVELRLKTYKIMLNALSFVRKSFEKKMSQSRKVDWVSGAFMMIKNELFDKIDGFDEDYFLYFEDIDFCRRLADEGYYAYYIPTAECVHERGASVRKLPQKEIRRLKRDSQRRYYIKFNNFLSNFFLKWVTFKR